MPFLLKRFGLYFYYFRKSMAMKKNNIHDVTKKELFDEFDKIQNALAAGNFAVCNEKASRAKNSEFIERYSLSKKGIIEALFDINENSFAYMQLSKQEGKQDHVLFFFATNVFLYKWTNQIVNGKYKCEIWNVPIYVKIDTEPTRENHGGITIISIHDLNQPMKLRFPHFESITDENGKKKTFLVSEQIPEKKYFTGKYIYRSQLYKN